MFLHYHFPTRGSCFYSRLCILCYCGEFVGNTRVNDVFVDDATILLESLKVLAVALEALQMKSKFLKLQVSWAKTKVVV